MRVLIDQQFHRGHHYHYIAHLLPALIRAVDDVVVAVTPVGLASEEFQSILASFAPHVRFEPILEDEVILICPPGHSFAGRTITVDDLRGENLILMQEGAGVRQVVEDELRTLGVRLRDLSISLELGLQESVRSAVQAGYGITFISRTAVESDLAVGTVAEAHLQGMSAKREVSLVRASGRSQTRAAEAFVAFVRAGQTA